MAQYNIDQIKRLICLEEVAGHYVKLSRRGSCLSDFVRSMLTIIRR